MDEIKPFIRLKASSDCCCILREHLKPPSEHGLCIHYYADIPVDNKLSRIIVIVNLFKPEFKMSDYNGVNNKYHDYCVDWNKVPLYDELFCRHPKNMGIIECHGDKCRYEVGPKNNVWCISCYGELNFHNIGPYIVKMIHKYIYFEDIPTESIIYKKCTLFDGDEYTNDEMNKEMNLYKKELKLQEKNVNRLKNLLKLYEK